MSAIVAYQHPIHPYNMHGQYPDLFIDPSRYSPIMGKSKSKISLSFFHVLFCQTYLYYELVLIWSRHWALPI